MEFADAASGSLETSERVERSPFAEAQSQQEAVLHRVAARDGSPNIRSLYEDLTLPPLRNDNPPRMGPKVEALEPQAQTSEDIQPKYARDNNSSGMNSRLRDRTTHFADSLITGRYHDVQAHNSAMSRILGEDLPLDLFRACLAPLPRSTPEEDAFFQGHPTAMMEEELEEGRFHETPLDVEYGIAVLEESVEAGVPDVVTQA